MLEYLARYTHRTAISDERIVAIREGDVLLKVRAENGGKRVIRIEGPAVVGRFLQHVLPPGFKRIRHFGLLYPPTNATASPPPDSPFTSPRPRHRHSKPPNSS